MPTAPVDDKGAVFYYEDSGPPTGSTDYTTVVLFHGAVFHSGVYRPMTPFAEKYNLRLVLVNYRDYPGSTRYSSSELRGFTSSDLTVQTSTIEQGGLEVLAFVQWFIDNEEIPPTGSHVDGFSNGGIAMLAWSAGHFQLFSAIAHADRLSVDVRARLAEYLRGIILYEISSSTLGAPIPTGVYTPFRDPSLTMEGKLKQFGPWCTSYFTPVDLLPPSTHTSEHPLLPPLRSRVALGPLSSTSEPSYTVDRFAPTVVRMGPETLHSITDEDVLFRSQALYFNIDPSIPQENLHRTLFPAAHIKPGQEVTWPTLPIYHIWCDMTVGDCIWGAQFLIDFHAAHKGESAGRPFESYKLEGANHFVQWDEPERFVSFLAAIIAGRSH